ncbi:hypothetical protein [Methylobacterium ajmalii]|uniref:hypothetical protein n=1 Tax=Methylobacterium ajmalii TaxID=2738439 RepID=UPI002F360881
MTETDLSGAFAQLAELAANVGLDEDDLREIVREVDEKAEASGRQVSLAERLIAVRARIVQAGIGRGD